MNLAPFGMRAQIARRKPACLRLFLLYHVADLVLKNWHFVDHNVPYKVIIHAKIGVDEAIAHPGYRTPRNFGTALAHWVGNLFRGLTNDFDTTHKSSLERGVSKERLLG
jgi:hypothetical protein